MKLLRAMDAHARVLVSISVFALPAALPARAFAGDSILSRFERSRVSLTTYSGTGSFIAGDTSDNPYYSEELTLEPRFALFEHVDTRALLAVECEFSQPDNASGRHCSTSDLRVSIHHAKLWTDPLLDGSLRGSFAIYLPTSLESQFNHTVANVRATAGYSARFDVGLGTLDLGYALAIQKYLPTRRVRGFTVDGEPDSGLPLVNARGSAPADASIGSGGRYNDNWLFLHTLHTTWQFSERWALGVQLAIYDYFRFAVPDASSDPELSSVGRAQLTYGTIELSFEPLDHFEVAGGVASLQPALTSDNSALRFPFYDFISPESNYSKWYLTATLTY